MAAAAQMKIKSYLEKHKIGNLFEVNLSAYNIKINSYRICNIFQSYNYKHSDSWHS